MCQLYEQSFQCKLTGKEESYKMVKSNKHREIEKHRFRLNLAPISVFSVTGIFAMCVLACCFLFSHGELIEHYFFYDTRDTGMDFFHSLEYVRGMAPYALFNTLYPPLANLLFYVLYMVIPGGGIGTMDAYP